MINVYYDSRGMVLLEFEGAGLELEREEAEELFVRLGHALQDMDITEGQSNVEADDRHIHGE